MKKYKVKLLAYTTALTITLQGCIIYVNNFFNKDKIDTPSKNFTTSTIEPTIGPIMVPEETIETTMTVESTEVTEQTEPPVFNVEPTNQTEPTIETTSPENIEKQEILYAKTDVNIRTSDTDDSLKIGELKLYDKVYKILSYDNNWTLVKTNDIIGYVYNDYLEETDEYIEIDYEHKEYKDIVLTTATNLFFRREPNTETQIISSFAPNTELEVISKVDNGWLLVKHQGTIGYVYEEYTKSLLEEMHQQYPEINLTNLDVQKIVYTTATSLNIRSGSSTKDEIIRTMETYESAKVLLEDNEWYFVMTNEYEFGYINKNYTKDLDGVFVIVDISKQRLYLYNNDELYLVTKVTTGKNSTPSNIGLFSIWYKGMNEEIVPGKIVKYWMPYNYDMEGLHDAYWRTIFGEQNYTYGGSNGCINMPEEMAKITYENTSLGTKVLVHK